MHSWVSAESGTRGRREVRNWRKVFFFVRTGESKGHKLLPTHLKLKELAVNKLSGAFNTSCFPLELFGTLFEGDPVTQKSKSRKVNLDLDGGLNSLALLLLAGVGLGTHDTTTPVTAGLLVLVGVALLDGGQELGELSLVLGAGLGQSQDGGGLKTVELEYDLGGRDFCFKHTFLWTTVPRRALPLTMA